MMETKYKYKGEYYTDYQLFKLLKFEYLINEKKKKWSLRRIFDEHNFSAGFRKGVLYGIDLVMDPDNNKFPDFSI